MVRMLRRPDIKNFAHNSLFFLSGCAGLLLNIFNLKTVIPGILLAVVLLLVCCCFPDIRSFFLQHGSGKIIILACLLAFLSAAVCYNALLAHLDMPRKIPLLVFAAGCGTASVYFLCVILCLIRSAGADNKGSDESVRTRLSRMDAAGLTCILLLILGVGLWYLSQKCSFFTDEMYTFGLANSYYEPYLVNPADDIGVIGTADRYVNYVTVTDHPFSYGSVIYNQICDVHPPLYYFFIHTVCSVAPGLSLMYVGYLVNALFAVLLIAVLFVWFYRKFGRTAAYAIALSYGLSTGFYSMFMLFRMYMMLTFFTVLLTSVLHDIYTEKSLRHRETLAAVLCLGAFTHYYFLIYAFCACLLTVLLLAAEKRGKELISLIVSVIGAGSIYYCVWGGILIDQMTGMSGGLAVSNLLGMENLVSRFKSYGVTLWSQIADNNVVSKSILALIVLIVLVTVLSLLRKRSWNDLKSYLLIFFPGALSFIIVVLCNSTAVYSRYIYNLVPFIWMALWAGLFYLVRNLMLRAVVSFAVTAVSAYCALFCAVPSYLFLEYKDTIDYLKNRGEDTVCIYFKSAPWYYEIICINFFMDYQTTYVVDEYSMDWLGEQELDTSDSILLLAEDASHIDEVLSLTGCTEYEMIGLYSPIDSETYYVVAYELSK